MKTKFSFIQIANLIYILKKDLLSIKKNISEEEFRNILIKQRKNLKLLIEVLEKKKKLTGIQKEFLNNLSKIKKELNIEE